MGNYSMPRYFQNMPVVGKPVKANAENATELRAIEDDIHAHVVKALEAGKKPMIITAEVDKMLVGSASNIPGVKTALVNTLNAYDILNADKFIVVKDAVAKLEEVYK